MASGRVLALVVVLGGLRPDMVTADVMPNLVRFTGIATTYTNARSVFPSVSAVAAASLATGALPRAHGVVSSEVYWPQVSRERLLNLEDFRVVRGVDQTLGGRLVDCATFADALAAHGRRVSIVATGASPLVHVINPRAAQHGHWSFATADRAASPTAAAWDETVAKFGYPPERELPRFEEVRYATNAMIDLLTGGAAPDVALLWLSEPGDAARYRGLGSEVAESAMRHVDKQLGRLLDALDEAQGLDRTLVIVASDHGAITSEGEIDVAEQLRIAGLASACPTDQAQPFRLVATGGGCGALFAREAGERAEAHRAAAWLMQQSWIGNVFTRSDEASAGAVPGSLPLSLVGLDHSRAPEVMFTLASDLGLDANGLAGRGLVDVPASGALAAIGGLNRHEMSVVLAVAGPGVARGHKSDAEAGLIDVAPTILGAAGVPLPATMIGRDLVRGTRSEQAPVVVEAGTGRYVQKLLVSASERGVHEKL